MLKYLARSFLFVAFFLMPALSYAEEFNPKRVRLVDEKNGHYLFRGNVPIKDGKFAYEKLMETIFENLINEGKEVPENPKLVVVSLLNRFLEFMEIAIEEKWFTKNPDKGSFHLYPLYGALVDPCNKDAARQKEIFFDDLDTLTQLLADMLEENTSSPQIIYMHCKVGKDRTGEANAAYKMRYKNYSFAQVMQDNEEVARRKLRTLSLNAIKKDALKLREILGHKAIGDVDDCFSPLEVEEVTLEKLKEFQELFSPND